MFNKFKNWFNNNRNPIATIFFFISALLFCANLFSGICSNTITIIGCCLVSMGTVIMLYDYKKEKENDKNN